MRIAFRLQQVVIARPRELVSGTEGGAYDQRLDRAKRKS